MGSGIDYPKTIKALKASMGMTQRQLSEYFGIPLQTIKDWECGKRKPPEYTLRLLLYKAKMEKMLSEPVEVYVFSQ